MAPTVCVVHTEDFSEEGIRKATFDAIDKSDFRFPNGIKSAMLKVNLRYYWDYSTGETTDPRIVSAIIDYIRQRSDDGIEVVVAEADASAMRTRYAFRMLGYEKLARRKKVKLTNLCDCEKVERQVAVNGKKFSLTIARDMIDTDLLVNVTKLRVHRLTTISCCLKNMFGAMAIPKKVVYHPNLDEVIVAMNKLTRPNLAVVDGLISLGRTPIRMGLVLAGKDPVAVDFVATKTMGYNPRRIRHLQLAEREGVGTCENVRIHGVEDLNRFSRVFPRENFSVVNLLWSLKLVVLGSYLKVTNDTRPPVLDR